MSNLCAQQLREIGADVRVQVDAQVDWAGQEAYLIGWGSPFDPDDHTYKVFGTGKGANYSGYSDAKVDGLLRQARETSEDVYKRQVLRRTAPQGVCTCSKLRESIYRWQSVLRTPNVLVCRSMAAASLSAASG